MATPNPAQVYLGDGVYVQPDARWPAQLTLTTENGLSGGPTNTIYLEPEVADALRGYITRHFETLDRKE